MTLPYSDDCLPETPPLIPLIAQQASVVSAAAAAGDDDDDDDDDDAESVSSMQNVADDDAGLRFIFMLASFSVAVMFIRSGALSGGVTVEIPPLIPEQRGLRTRISIQRVIHLQNIGVQTQRSNHDIHIL